MNILNTKNELHTFGIFKDNCRLNLELWGVVREKETGGGTFVLLEVEI